MPSKSSKSKSKGKKTHSDNVFETLSPSSPSTIPAVLAEKTASKKTKMGSSEKALGKRPSSESESTAGPSRKYSAMIEDNERLLKE